MVAKLWSTDGSLSNSTEQLQCIITVIIDNDKEFKPAANKLQDLITKQIKLVKQGMENIAFIIDMWNSVSVRVSVRVSLKVIKGYYL